MFRAKDYILKAVQGDASFNAMDFTKFSRSYKIEVPLVGSVEGNIIFDSANYMPREVMLATTLDNFNAEILEVLYKFIIKYIFILRVLRLYIFVYIFRFYDCLWSLLFQIGLEGEGFESAIEVLFGENGFFPDTISKAMYWANDKIPHPIKQVLEKWISPLRGERMKRQVNILFYLKSFKCIMIIMKIKNNA